MIILREEAQGRTRAINNIMLASDELPLGAWLENDTSNYIKMFLRNEDTITYKFLEKKYCEGKIKSYNWTQDKDSSGECYVLEGFFRNSSNQVFMIDEVSPFMEELKGEVKNAYAYNKIFFQIPSEYLYLQEVPINHAVWILIDILFENRKTLADDVKAHDLIAKLTRVAYKDVQIVNLSEYFKKMYEFEDIKSLVSDDEFERYLSIIETFPEIKQHENNKIPKEDIIIIAKTRLEKSPKLSDEYYMLKVGILGLEGNGHAKIVNKHITEITKTPKWARTKREEFVEYMKDKVSIDVSSHMPQDPRVKKT